MLDQRVSTVLAIWSLGKLLVVAAEGGSKTQGLTAFATQKRKNAEESAAI